MLDEWLQTLENKKQEAISKVRAFSKNENIIDLAIKEIEIHYMTIRQKLTIMQEKGYRLSDDLSRINGHHKDWWDIDYSVFCDSIEHHLQEIEGIPKRVKSGRFQLEYTEVF